MLYQDSMNTNVLLFSNPATGFSLSIPSGAPPNRRAVDLLRAAVKSLEPQVLEIIAGAQTELHGLRNAEVVDRYAWLYVACQRGLDCSPTSHWATDCSENCDVSSPEGIVEGWSGGAVHRCSIAESPCTGARGLALLDACKLSTTRRVALMACGGLPRPGTDV